eukprot:10014629-Alexandrium_andersonii.AAC.1
MVQQTADFRSCQGSSPRLRAGGWSATAGGIPGQTSGGHTTPQTSAPAGAQSTIVDGSWQPTWAWGWSATAGGVAGRASDPLPDARA